MIQSNFSREQKDNLIEFLQNEIKKHSEDIELSSLEKIIITDNFTEVVVQTQKEYEMHEIGHTDNADGIAVAKVLHTEVGNDIRQTIVFNSNIIAGLFNPDYSQNSYHYFHHELCHVHDNFNQHIMFSQEARAGKGLNKLDHLLVYNAQPIWCEYIAVRMSAHSIPLNDPTDLPAKDLYTSFLLTMIDSCKKKLESAIENYRLDADMNKLFVCFQEETSLLFKVAATVQGYIDGLFIEKQELTGLIDEKIKQTFFYNTWIKQRKSLRNLYSLYPKWNDVYQLIDLGEAIRMCWGELGIFPIYKPEDDLIYVGVPFGQDSDFCYLNEDGKD